MISLMTSIRRLKNALLLCVLPGALLLSGCATAPEPKDYADQQPVLELRRYFDGTVDGWGIVQDRSGKVIKRFSVVITASWNGDTGTLDEHFLYADGTRQQRVWTIRDMGGGRYLGTAGDVIGEATGTAAGNALRWTYTLALPVDGKTIHVDFDDWMFLVDDDVMLNRSVMTKFGIVFADVTLSFRKRR